MLTMILNPKRLEKKVMSLWLPEFSITSKLTLKESLSKRPEMEEFFSAGANYSRMTEELIKVEEVYHTVI
jgi:serine protease inhibitor